MQVWSTSPGMAFLSGIGGPELLLIFLVVLLFFGARRLPELARGLGKSIREFKKATQEVEDDFRQAMDQTPPAAKPSAPPVAPAPANGATPKPPSAQAN